MRNVPYMNTCSNVRYHTLYCYLSVIYRYTAFTKNWEHNNKVKIIKAEVLREVTFISLAEARFVLRRVQV